MYKNPSHSKSNKDIYTELCIVKYLQYRKCFKEFISLHFMIKEVHLSVDINHNNMGGKRHKTLCPTLFIMASNSSWIMKSDLLEHENQDNFCNCRNVTLRKIYEQYYTKLTGFQLCEHCHMSQATVETCQVKTCVISDVNWQQPG